MDKHHDDFDVGHLGTNWYQVLVNNGCNADRATILAAAIDHTLSVSDGQFFSEGEKPLVNGECYALLFSGNYRKQVLKLGMCPTVASLRRFANSVKEPHEGVRVSVEMNIIMGKVVWHVSHGEVSGATALAYMDKNAHVGATLPTVSSVINAGECFSPADGAEGSTADLHSSQLVRSFRGYPPGEDTDFPASWIPARRECLLAWDYKQIVIRKDRVLDFKHLAGKHKPHDEFADIDSEVSKLQWEFKLHPLAPKSDEFTVFEHGEPIVTTHWTSPVASDSHLQRFAVRGMNVMCTVTSWRPSRELLGGKPNDASNGKLPGEKDELFVGADGMSDLFVDGKCYLRLFRSACWADASAALGSNPKAQAIIDFAKESGAGFSSLAVAIRKTGKGKWHVVDGDIEASAALYDVPGNEIVGSTQDQVTAKDMGAVSGAPAALSTLVGGSNLELEIPVAAVVTGKADDLGFSWNLSRSGSLHSSLKHFESAQLTGMSINLTVTGGDNDTTALLALDTLPNSPVNPFEWHSAPYSLVVSGNVNGATSGALELPRNHVFGTQLKGLSVGNLPPVIHCKLVTKVPALLLVRGVVRVQVAGRGIVMAINMNKPSRSKAGGVKNLRQIEESEDDDEATNSRKVAG